MRGRHERNVRQRSEEPMDIDPMDLSPEVSDHWPRESTQADYANAILNGTANLGDSLEAFSNTVRRDLTQFSIIKDNCYLLDFYTKRSQSILPPSMDISTYQHRVVLQNALLEFSLEDYQWINPTSVRWTACQSPPSPGNFYFRAMYFILPLPWASWGTHRGSQGFLRGF